MCGNWCTLFIEWCYVWTGYLARVLVKLMLLYDWSVRYLTPVGPASWIVEVHCSGLHSSFCLTRWCRLRLNMMPITAGLLEPMCESLPLGIYASWSAYHLFGISPYLWFAGHWTVWCILDYIQLRRIQARSTYIICTCCKRMYNYVIFVLA